MHVWTTVRSKGDRMMYTLSKEEQEWQARVREFAQEVLRPRAPVIDRTGEFPADIIAQLGRMGVMGMVVPPEYGGPGCSTLAYILAVEEVSRACGSTGITVAAHNSLCTAHIVLAGNEEQKNMYLPGLAKGERLGAWGLTEPNAGSDAGGTQTYAVREGDGWTINGQKVFCTNGHVADVLVIMAKTDRGSSGSRGISAFVLPKGTKGLKLGSLADKLGLKGSVTSELFFEDMWLPEGSLLGEEGGGFRDALTVLDSGRISIGALGLGLAQGALDVVLEHVRSGVDLKARENEWVGIALAEMATDVEAARRLVYHAARFKDSAGRPVVMESCFAKLYASEAGMRCASRAVDLLAPSGGTRDAERILRDVKLCEIGEGTSEIQRLVISRHLGL